MKCRLRVLLVGRHFWPHGSIDSAALLYQLAVGLHRSGVHVEVMSPRYASSWPEELVLREIPVHRPAAAPRSDWSMGRYVRHLTHWLRDHIGGFDVVLVDSIREEAIAAVDAARGTSCKTIVRYGGWGPHSDAIWWQRSRAAKRCAAFGKMADAAVCSTAAGHRALLTEGYIPSRIHRIGGGFAADAARSSASKQAARQALASINSDLSADDGTIVIAAIGPMTRDGGIHLIAQSARLLIQRYPKLRLWLIGDGPYRDSIHELLRGDGVRKSVAMPGSFGEVEDVLAAADVYLQADEVGLDYFLPAAISAELPVVAIDNESTRSIVTGANSQDSASIEAVSLVNWYSVGTSKALRTAVRQVLDQLPERRDRAAALRRLMLRTVPQSESVASYVTLMKQLAGQPADCDSSAEAVS